MELVDCRRLTGPNLVWDEPCAVLEAELESGEAERVIVEWEKQARTMLDAIGWTGESTRVYRCTGGAIFVLTAPADAQFVATEIAEWAWHAMRAALTGGDPPDLVADAAAFRQVIADESNPRLLELAAAAKKQDVTFLADEDRASVGLGTGVRSWPVRALPDVAEVPWRGVHDIPVGLVTGSHGKTTCIRLVAAIATAAGKRAGTSTSASLTLGDEVIERGDCADSESARDLLRERRLQVAVLEAPLAEVLHRGLPVPRATAALITSATEDPGEVFGARTPEECADALWIVTRALTGQCPLVLNADDPMLVARAARARVPIVWYSLDPDHAVLKGHAERAGTIWSVREGMVTYLRGRQWRSVAAVADVPIALGGAARHNVSNALGAAALAQALGLPERAIAMGLRTSTRDAHPGAANSYTIAGVRVLADRASDSREMTAIAELVAKLPSVRRALAFGAFGDQSDDALRALARAAWRMRPERIFIDELPQYLRGREPGSIARILRAELEKLGAHPERISEHAREAATLDSALGWARPGDLVVMIALGDLAEVLERLSALELSKTERRA